jgi:hypothetical protein
MLMAAAIQVLLSVGCQQDDLRTLDLADRQRLRSRPLLQGLSLFVTEHYRRGTRMERPPHYKEAHFQCY